MPPAPPSRPTPLRTPTLSDDAVPARRAHSPSSPGIATGTAGQAQERKLRLVSTREQASLLLLVAFLGWASTRRDLRRHVRQFLRLLADPVLWLPFLLMFAYISMEVWIGFQLDLWNVDLLTATFIWAVASGGVLLFKSATEANEDPFFFHNTVAATLAPTVFVTFFMNLATLGYWRSSPCNSSSFRSRWLP